MPFLCPHKGMEVSLNDFEWNLFVMKQSTERQQLCSGYPTACPDCIEIAHSDDIAALNVVTLATKVVSASAIAFRILANKADKEG